LGLNDVKDDWVPMKIGFWMPMNIGFVDANEN
jgi:hypothetical protein